MATIFDQWDIQKASRALAVASKGHPDASSGLKYYEGDHWQDGKGWAGPMLDSTDAEFKLFIDELTRGFISRNLVGETLDRHVNGILGRDVAWEISPRRKMKEGEEANGDEKGRIEEGKERLHQWIDDREIQQEIDTAARNMLLGEYSTLRTFVPPAELTSSGRVPSGTLEESLDRIYFHIPALGAAATYVDPNSQRKVGIYSDKEIADPLAEGDTGQDRIELSYTDGPATILRVLTAANAGDRLPFPLGRRRLHLEIKRPALVTPQLISQQKLYNLANTMLQRNVILGGFLERVIKNAKLPGSEIVRDGKVYHQADPVTLGAGRTLILNGWEITNKDGSKSVLTPDVQYHDPVEVATFIATMTAAYHSILAATHQLHYAMSDDATASSASRVTAMAAYVIDLNRTKQQIDLAFAWTLETALNLAAIFAGNAGRFADLQISAAAKVDPGPLTSEEKRVIAELVTAELLSEETGRASIGVDDLAAEAQRIEEQRQRNALAATQGLATIERALEQRNQRPVTVQPPANGNGTAPTNGSNGTPQRERIAA